MIKVCKSYTDDPREISSLGSIKKIDKARLAGPESPKLRPKLNLTLLLPQKKNSENEENAGEVQSVWGSSESLGFLEN